MLTFRPVVVSPRASALFESTNTSFSARYLPSRGLPFSLLVHGTALLALVLVSLFQTPMPQIDPPKWPVPGIPNRQMVVMYLPAIAPGGASARGQAELRRNGPPRASAPRTRGLVYPGPQTILSEFPEPTNRVQTILQPELKNSPILKTPLSLPNLVLMADAGLAPQFRPPDATARAPEHVEAEEQSPKRFIEEEMTPVEPAPPAVESKSSNPIDALRLEVPAPLPLPRRGIPQLVIAPPPVRVPENPDSGEPAPERVDLEPKIEPKAEPPSAKADTPVPPVDLSPVPIGGASPRNLLALSVMPMVSQGPVEIPAGEARGRFAISREPNLAVSETEPGSPDETVSSEVAANLAAGSAGPKATGGKPPSMVTISFGPRISENDHGSASGGEGGGLSGSRPGTATGPGGGTGSGGDTGPGRGTGSGNSPFAGVTIVGGAGSTGTAARSVTLGPAPRPLQTSYGLFVVSTERGGGGLPFFGVFGDQQVYTVFLDMRETESDPTPSWTFEFALARPPAPEDAATLASIQQGLVLPFPVVKKRPALPPELVRRHLGKMIVVYGVIGTEGKMEQMSVKESPDPLLSQSALQALNEWVFRPAQLDGRPVIMRALLGMRLWLPR
jgi:hypothetical protein